MRNFIVAFSVSTLIFLLPIAAAYFVLWRSAETKNLLELAARQQAGEFYLYGSAVSDTNRSYKLALIKHRQPEIVAIGSSRPLDFRQEFFTERFACACQAQSSMEDFFHFYNEMRKLSSPKILLWSLDFWWFGRKTRVLSDPVAEFKNTNYFQPRLTWRKLLKFFDFFWQGKISLSDLPQLVGGRFNQTDGLTFKASGIQAIVHGVGIRADGSAAHYRRVNGREDVTTMNNILDGVHNPESYLDKNRGRSSKYAPDYTLNKNAVNIFKDALRQIKKDNIKVVVVLPPISPSLYKMMKQNRHRYKYLDDLQKEIKNTGIEYYDFTDIRKLNSNVCEMSDMHHASNVAYQRILLKIISDYPKSALAPYLDKNQLERDIDKFKGKIINVYPNDPVPVTETDFLRAGCIR